MHRTLAPVAVVAVVALTRSPVALGLDEVDAALVRRLDLLEQRVAAISDPDRARVDAVRRAEVERLILDVLADAEKRSALRDGGTADYDGDFFVQSDDGGMRLRFRGQIMVRWVANRRQDQPVSNDESIRGFELRRAKIAFGGSIAEPAIDWGITLAFDRRTGVGELQSFSINKEITPELELGIARARPPLTKEESISSRRQLAAERSLVVRQFNQGRRVGALLEGEWDVVRLDAGVFDQTEDQLDDGSITVSARGEWLLTGRFRDLRDFSSFPDDEVVAALGGGVRYSHVDSGDDDDDGDLLRWTADLTFELGGANLMAEVIGSHDERGNDGARDQLGVVVQGGMFLGRDWEVFLRQEWGDADGLAPDLSIITFGVTRFFDGHDKKFTADIGYGLEEVDGFWANDGAGWLPDEEGSDGQVVVRAQFQLLW